MKLWNWKKIKRYFLLQGGGTAIAIILYCLHFSTWLILLIISIYLFPFLWKWAREDYKRIFGGGK